MGSVSHHPERYRQSNQRLCYVHDSTWGSQVMLDPLEHTWSRSDLMCREGRALKTPRCCRGHSTVFDSTDDMLVWLHNFESTTKLKEKLQDETFRNDLEKYLERIIKQGYLEASDAEEDERISQNFQNLDVSEVSFKYPVNHDEPEFTDDVNKL